MTPQRLAALAVAGIAGYFFFKSDSEVKSEEKQTDEKSEKNSEENIDESED